MLNLNLTSLFRTPSTVPTFAPGTLVTVETVRGLQTAVIERIATSPFYPECNQGVMRACVGSLPGEPFFVDYLLVEELVPAEPDFELELENDPDYIQYLNDCARYDYEEALLA